MENEIEVGNNLLIAEFMGGKLVDKLYPRDKQIIRLPTGNKYVDSLKYHSSWDWLMPVVERIEAIGYDSRIMGNDSDSGFLCDFVDMENTEAACVLGYKHNGSTKIKVVYQACVEFIAWLNSNKTTQAVK